MLAPLQFYNIIKRPHPFKVSDLALNVEAMAALAALLHDRADDVAEWLIDLGIDADGLLAELPLSPAEKN